MMLNINILKYSKLFFVSRSFWFGLLFVFLLVLLFGTIYFVKRNSSDKDQPKKQQFMTKEPNTSQPERINIAKEERLYNNQPHHEPNEPILIPEENLDEEEGE